MSIHLYSSRAFQALFSSKIGPSSCISLKNFGSSSCFLRPLFQNVPRVAASIADIIFFILCCCIRYVWALSESFLDVFSCWKKNLLFHLFLARGNYVRLPPFGDLETFSLLIACRGILPDLLLLASFPSFFLWFLWTRRFFLLALRARLLEICVVVLLHVYTYRIELCVFLA